MTNAQSGFTLQNMAVMIAIASLLATLTVKGRELADDSKTQSLAHDFRDLQSALFSYQNGSYGRHYPLTQRANDATAIPSPSIENELSSTLNKPFTLWQLATASSNDSNAMESYIPFSSQPNNTRSEAKPTPISGVNGHYIICSDDIPGRLVQRLDTMMDDGNTANGAMRIARAHDGGNAIANQDIESDSAYLACLAV